MSAEVEQKRAPGSWDAAQTWLRARDEVVDEMANLGFDVRELKQGYGVFEGSRLVAAFDIAPDATFAGGFAEHPVGATYLPHTTKEAWLDAVRLFHSDTTTEKSTS